MSEKLEDELSTIAILIVGSVIWIWAIIGASNAATVTHDLTKQESWAALTIKQPVKLAYGGTIAHDGGSVTIHGATVPMTVTVDMYHRYMNPGTGGLRIGGLSVEWDADGWQVRNATGTVIHREAQPRAWSGKRVKAALSITETGLTVTESGQEPVRIGHYIPSVKDFVLWSSVKTPENAPRWLAVGIETADPTPTPSPTESPTEAPTAIPTPTPVGYPWVWTLTLGPDGPVGRWFQAPTLILPDGTRYEGELMPLGPWIGGTE